ncbi:hypothetical protein VNO78_10993 [Psophocarpus tetragonolobus]|uniref:Uncharacterized protein n=1 Tax=Psophocarpus tetragonolobus TaxID=3891 RepID=A0AAN9SNE3_PSOTE
MGKPANHNAKGSYESTTENMLLPNSHQHFAKCLKHIESVKAWKNLLPSISFPNNQDWWTLKCGYLKQEMETEVEEEAASKTEDRRYDD